jgi:hypothetical protein
VNHSVHVFMRGCLTLKFSGSWKTVRTSPSAVSALLDDFSPEPSVGEIGIVSSGTCWLGFGAVATSAIVSMCERAVRRIQSSVDAQIKPAAKGLVGYKSGCGCDCGCWWWAVEVKVGLLISRRAIFGSCSRGAVLTG